MSKLAIKKPLKKVYIKEKDPTVETVFLTPGDKRRASQFVKARVNDNVELYNKRGGFKEIDILAGAYAEIAVYKFLKKTGFPVGRPDFSIHEVRKKSFDPDLTDGIHHFHIKGQTLDSKRLYGSSWIMQRTDPIINNPKPLNYLVPCTVDTDLGRVEIHGVMSLMTLISHGCIGECKNAWFQKTKVAIYLDHIEGVLTKFARWNLLKKGLERLEGK